MVWVAIITKKSPIFEHISYKLRRDFENGDRRHKDVIKINQKNIIESNSCNCEIVHHKYNMHAFIDFVGCYQWPTVFNRHIYD